MVEGLMIEASAGTGKTYTIQHLVVNHLNQGVKLQEILVVTFTKASTKELQERILLLLREKKMEEALREYDSCEIDTIHAFAKRMLSTYAFEANLFVEEMRDGEPLEQERVAAARDFVRTDLEGLSYGLAQKKVMLSFLKELPQVKPASGLTFEQLYHKFCALKLPPMNLVDAAPHFYKKADAEEIEQFQNRLSEAHVSLETFDQLLFAPMNVLEHFSALKKKGVAPAWLPDFQEKLTPLLEYALSKEILAQRFMHDLEPLIRERTLKVGRFGCDEILTSMQQSLKSEPFKQAVRSRYKVVLIDEFQDTDPVQWEIFSTLFLSQWDGHLYLVGDPKQSIYGFRSADIYTYLKASENLPKLSLDTNYRSHPNLVEELNEFFATDTFIPLPKLGIHLPYHPVKAGRADPKEEGKRIDFFEGESKEAVLADMTALIQKRGCAGCCVLVKDKNQSKEVSDYFKEYQVPHFFLKRLEWEDSPYIYHLKLFLKALQHPEDLHRLKALLGSKLGGYSATELLTAPYPELMGLLKKIAPLNFYAAFDRFKSSPFCRAVEFEPFYKLIDMAEKKKGDVEGFLDRLYLGVEKEEESLFNPKEMEGDGVAICTIHMSKGLEFPHVFAIGVGASQRKGESEERERQLYVALTRAKESLYVPLYPGREDSLLSYYLEKHPGKAQFRREAHLPDPHFSMPKKERPKKVSLETPFKKRLHLIQSYTSLADEVVEKLEKLPKGEMPRGKEVGITIHDLLERVPYQDRTKIPAWVEEELRGHRLAPWSGYLADVFCKVFEQLGEVTLIRELEFLYAEREEYTTGRMDALFQRDGKYYLVDWKTNWLPDYSEEALRDYMVRSSYPLQARIYKRALQLTVESVEKRDFESCFGGFLYIFLRGIPEGKGVILWK